MEAHLDAQSRTSSILSRLLPALLMIGLAAWAVVGPNGLLALIELKGETRDLMSREAALRREANLRQYQLYQLTDDPLAAERLAAEEGRVAGPNTVLVEFHE